MAETMAASFQQIGMPLRIAAILSGQAERAGRLASRYGAAATTEIDAFLAKVDAVYVATSNARHFALVRSALLAGRPVLVEKPLTISAAETEELISLSRRTRVLLVENFWTLTLPAHRRLRELIEHGGLGAPRHLSFDFSSPLTPEVFPGLFDPVAGGVLLDRAVYGLAAADDLLGPVVDLAAQIVRDDNDCDVTAALLARHSGGATSQISVSMISGGTNTLSLGFARGRAQAMPSLGAERVEIVPMSPPAERGAATAAGIRGALKRMAPLRRLRRALPPRAEFHDYGGGLYMPMARHFSDLVRAGDSESPVVPLELSARVSRLLKPHRGGAGSDMETA